MHDLATGDLGRSYINDSPVWPLLRERLPTTLVLLAGGLVLWLAGGLLLGVLAATRPWFDRVLGLLIPVGLAVPAFVLGLLLLAVFFGGLGDLGVRMFEPGPPLQENFWKRITLPWVTLAFLQLATYTRLTRAAMLDVLDADFLRTARAKGLPERRVLYGHGLRAALTPVISQTGVDVGALLGGSVVIEKVFGLQGVGQLVVDSIGSGDAPVVLGVVLLTVTGVVLAGFLSDLAHAVVDPRVRLG
jgi:peptide/nickel transport system permease protein